VGKWSKRARDVINRVVAENPTLSGDDLLAKIDDAYPFGERRYHPYKCWLAERAAFRARTATAEQGPIARPCGACGAKLGRPCVEFQGEGHGRNHPPMAGFHEARIQPDSGALFATTANRRGGE
jgi:hypothetical protein